MLAFFMRSLDGVQSGFLIFRAPLGSH